MLLMKRELHAFFFMWEKKAANVDIEVGETFLVGQAEVHANKTNSENMK